ncbi:hypothetical protein [Actinoplanes sp. NPDC051851]|uniref:hypothetical protein n=1 Tax=Actinoplanes sp. NPDC051851 TaxID=3154753 RepID=UPI003443866E
MTDETPGPLPVRLVLDSSAIAAWVRGSPAVGELLAEIDREGGLVVVPLTCLLQASAQIKTDREWLYLLLEHPATQVVSDDPDDWEMLSSAITLLGAADLASAGWLALECGVDVLTRHAELYAGLADGNVALQIEEDY